MERLLWSSETDVLVFALVEAFGKSCYYSLRENVFSMLFCWKTKAFYFCFKGVFCYPSRVLIIPTHVKMLFTFFSSIFNDCLENSHVNFYINVGLKNQRLVYSFTIPLDLYIKKDL